MNLTIRRGAGLLVVAVIVLLIDLIGDGIMRDNYWRGRDLFVLGMGILLAASLFGGLGMIAWGLLRKPHSE